MTTAIKKRVSIGVLLSLLDAIAPNSDFSENLLGSLNAENRSDVAILCQEILEKRLQVFSPFGVQLCKNSLLYCIKFDMSQLDDMLDIWQVPFIHPRNLLLFYTWIWEILFKETFPDGISPDDFYLDEVRRDEYPVLVYATG